MIWVDREAQKIKKNAVHNKAHSDDMKTPSGRVHVGALRGVVIHDLIYKVLLENEVDATYTYVFNDFDQMDAIPSYLDKDKWEKYSGMPLSKIPSPEPGYKSFGEYYAKEFIEVFESINCHPQIIWGSEYYDTGKMDPLIKTSLDNADKIREIYERFAKKKRPADWHPFQPICEACGKMGTTYVYKWDGELVWYRCVPDMAKWAKGCGNEGKVSPYKGNGKLHWKVDWPALWKTIGVTVESSGKDHMSHGGSYDVSSAIAREVFSYDPPYAMGGYEWFTIGGKKMSSSKGIGTSAKEVSQILPPELLRFLIVRTPIDRHLDFDPMGDTIPNLFDDYDRCLNAYFDKLEGKIPEGKQGDVLGDFARIAQLSEVRALPENRIFLPRFRTVVNLLKSKIDIKSFFEKQKGSSLTDEEQEHLEERVVFAEVYLKNYAGEDAKTEMIDRIPSDLSLTQDQKKFLATLSGTLKKATDANRDQITDMIFGSLKEHDLKPRDVFSAFYQILIGRSAGPKAADLIIEFGIDRVVTRIEEVVS